MGIQIKGFCFASCCGLLLMFLSLARAGAEQKSDVVRVREEGDQMLLETAVWSFEKEKRVLDLVGVIHLADREYYERLQEKLQSYERVFFEMVGSGKPLPRSQEAAPSPQAAKDQLGVVTQMYSLYTGLLQLSSQQDVIDYSPPSFIHADVTRSEFQSMQREQKESIMGYALSQASLFANIDQATLLSAMISGNSALLKRQMMQLLAEMDQGDPAQSERGVIIGQRNKKALQVMEDELRSVPALRQLAIFYGAAHLPDFAQRLLRDGWTERGKRWLVAWRVEGAEKK